MPDNIGKVHVWVPGIVSSKDGIQTFSLRLVEALCEMYGREKFTVLAKNDLPKDARSRPDLPQLKASGHWPLTARTLRFALGCLEYVRREHPLLIVSTHLHFGPLAHLVKRATKAPYVLVAHGIEAWQLTNDARRKALQQADLVLAVSRHTRDWLIAEGGVHPRRVDILPNTFIPAQFAIGDKSPLLLERYGFNRGTKIILTVGRLSEVDKYKGYDRIIQALPQILREVPEARYLLVGSGADRPRIERLIAETGVRNAVVLAGFVPDEELVAHYQLCDVFAMPSKGEGFGIVYLEALACGKPVVAGNKDGSRDALADGELGILVNPDDRSQIAAEVVNVLLQRHPHPLIFQPALLRRKVNDLYGFETFKRVVVNKVQPFLRHKPA